MLVLFLLIKQCILQATHRGFWFQYLPFSNIKASGNFILNDKSTFTGQCIMANYDFNTTVVYQQQYMWLAFNGVTLNITINEYGTSITNFTQDPTNFEGMWIYAYFESLESGSKLYIKGSKLWSVQMTTSNIVPFLNQYGKLDKLNFDYFHGKYSAVEIFTRPAFKNDNEFEQFFQKNLKSPLTYNKVVLDVFDGIRLFGDTFFSSQFLMLGYKYQIRCWVKISYENVAERQRYLLMRLTLNENYKNDTYVGDRVVLMSYVLDATSTNYNLFNVSVLAYNYPYPNLAFVSKASGTFVIQNTTNRDRFQRWHFIYYQYLVENTYMKVIFPDDQEIYQQLTGLQFHDQYIYLYVGADSFFYKTYLGGKIQLEITYNYENEIQYEMRCHYSCQTCNGPTQSNCVTCPQNSNRILKNGICACDYGLVDLDLVKRCNRMNELYPIITETFQNNTFKCKYGEFLTENKCMPCPSLINDFQLNCADCLLNSSTWYQNPVCTFDYKRYDLNSTFIKYNRNETQQEIFFINSQFLDLELCIGCLKYCNDITKLTCIEFNQLYYSCKQGYYISGNKCEKCIDYCQICTNSESCNKCNSLYGFDGSKCQKCPINCLDCNSTQNCLTCQPGFALFKGACYACGTKCSICEFSFDELRQSFINRCLKCTDPALFEISYDAMKCQPVQIKNCIYSISSVYFPDYPITTLDLYFQPGVINGSTYNMCARCASGLTFSNVSATCYKSSNLCQEFGFYNGSFFCLIGGEIANSILGCETKIQNCYECVNYLNKVICLNCFPGFYADHIIGTCVQCPPGCLSCSQQLKKNKSNWKKDTRPFYEFYVNKNVNHDYLTYVESSNPNDFEIICTSCPVGQEVYNDICINKCPTDCLECLVINNSKVCSKCSYSSNGLILSLSNNECYQCHSLCKFCAPASNVTITQFTNQCLLPAFQNTLFDSNIYQFSNCVDNEK